MVIEMSFNILTRTSLLKPAIAKIKLDEAVRYFIWNGFGKGVSNGDNSSLATVTVSWFNSSIKSACEAVPRASWYRNNSLIERLPWIVGIHGDNHSIFDIVESDSAIHH